MLFNFFCYWSFILFNPVVVDATNHKNRFKPSTNIPGRSGNQQQPQLSFDDKFNIKKLVSAGLIRSSNNTRISLNANIRTAIRKKCPKHINAIEGPFNNAQNSALGNSIGAIKSSFDGCGEDIYASYRDLSHSFAKQISEAYKIRNSQFSVGAGNASRIWYMSMKFINFVSRNMSPDQPANVSEMRKKILSYKDFEDQCLLGLSVSVFDKSSVATSFGGGIPPDKYKILKKILQNEECWRKKREFEDFVKGQVFRDFVSLPERCRANDERIKRIKKHIIPQSPSPLEEESFFVHCVKELERTANFCYCGNEQCLGDGRRTDEILLGIHEGSKKLCKGSASAINRSYNNCQKRANKCKTSCNKGLELFKLEYKELFFESSHRVGVSSLHVHFNTSCAEDIDEIRIGFNERIKRGLYKEELRGLSFGGLSSPGESERVGGMCDKSVEVLEAAYENLKRSCNEVSSGSASVKGSSGVVESGSRGVAGSSSGNSEGKGYGQGYGKGYGQGLEQSNDFNYAGVKSSGAVKSKSEDLPELSKKSDNRKSASRLRERREEELQSKKASGKKKSELGKAVEKARKWWFKGRVHDKWIRKLDTKMKDLGYKADLKIRNYLLDEDLAPIHKIRDKYKDKSKTELRREYEKSKRREKNSYWYRMEKKLKKQAYGWYEDTFPADRNNSGRNKFADTAGIMKRIDVDLEEVSDLMYEYMCHQPGFKCVMSLCKVKKLPCTLQGVIDRLLELEVIQLGKEPVFNVDEKAEKDKAQE